MSFGMRKLITLMVTIAAVVAGSFLCYYLGLGNGLSTLWGFSCGFLGSQKWVAISDEAELDRHVVEKQS